MSLLRKVYFDNFFKKIDIYIQHVTNHKIGKKDFSERPHIYKLQFNQFGYC